ncbi:bis(5'-nucleosyl)-tetraphosphatase PrpE [Lederbergia wuyishanensis]|uniref:Protein phosphatase n=1 Tax=Lederbergia wuyishanensis TaxID=1347903 RepID=A0ABU0CYZ4_9BACI|nr:bis(5'-nucleosyl)-tetraphosphatase PrpE [Lederbergia wuyishanensis]MCJ8006010.1 bis(5'-nucleosyl)-tetraphosphatase PrpE [Lederbergia wuyishanensis]MDQ0341377.1 protein phosphatase [Lederbergia wuyishanensis]
MNIDIIGDIHGCYKEFVTLTEKMDYSWQKGVPSLKNRKLAFVGDITDRGPDSLKMIEIVWTLWKHYGAYYVPGNHCNKLYRYFLGRNVQISHGLETTVAELKALSHKEQNQYKRMFMELYEESPLHYVLDNEKLVIAHAGIRADYIGKQHKSVKSFVLYGDVTGETLPNGMPVRRDWAKNYKGKPFIVYGHTPVEEPRLVGNTINIDTGAVFGGKLTALRYPEFITESVPSTMPLVAEKFTRFLS